ncbi:hypothetical protein BGZ68_001544 [Mortierella alpina]|nr:hypothetical protein BGZ68_001544 [Mortierella alpina]
MADRELKQFGHSLLNWVKEFPKNSPRYVYERLPIIKWLPKYNRTWALRDIIAGITVGLIVVPQGMSYAKVAGLPVQHGLYSAYIGAIFYCFMGTSKDLTIGPTAVISLITGELVAELAGRMTPQEVAAISCICVGAMTLILGVLRLGIILDFFPTTVLVGYTTGAAATIVIQQIPKWLGVPGINNRAPVYTIIITMFQAIKTLSWLDLVFGLVGFFLLISIGLAVDRWGRGKFSIQLIKISRFFIVTVLATAVSYAVNQNPGKDAKGQPVYRLSILKTVPSGLPHPQVPGVSSEIFSEIIPKLFAIALATILEHIAIAKAFARRNRYAIDTNQELLALGAANVTASFFGAYTVTGSFSRSAVKFQCGVKSPFAGFVTGALVLLALYFLTPAFFYIPDAALSAVIMVAVSTLISPPSVFIQFFKVNLWDFLSSQVALWVTVFVSVETGIAAGVGFSLLVLLFRIARPNFHVLRQLKDRPDVFIDASVDHTLDTVPAPHGILVFRIEESTTFPNIEAFQTWVLDEVYKYTRFGGRVKSIKEKLWSDDLEVHVSKLRKIAHGADSNITDNDLPNLRSVILDFSAVNNIDSTGLQGLFDLRELLRDYAGVTDYPSTFFEVHFVGIQANVLNVLELSGITRPVDPIALQKVEVIEDGTDDASDSDIKPVRPVPGDVGSAAISVLGSSPFLKEAGLVHLTVRDAVDSVLIRAQTWDSKVSKSDAQNTGSDSDSNSDIKESKTDIHYSAQLASKNEMAALQLQESSNGDLSIPLATEGSSSHPQPQIIYINTRPPSAEASARNTSPSVYPSPASSTTPSSSEPAKPTSAASSTASEAAQDEKGFIKTILDSNPYFSAGFGLMAVGAGLTIFRKATVTGASVLRRQLLVTLEIPSKDKSYLWFLHWMSSQSRGAGTVAPKPAAMNSKGMVARWTDRIANKINQRSQFLAVQTEFKQHDNGSVSTRFNLVPGNGKHIIRYRGAWIQVERTRDAKMMDLSTGAPWETVTLTTLSRDRQVFTELLQEAQKMALMNQEGKTVIYTSWGPEWRPFGQPRKRRVLESVILDEGIADRVVRDVQEFVKNEKWYADRGIPYRRGYLLYGPPGSGKTSFIQALAGELEYNICILNLSERGLTNDRLNHLLTNLPERSIMLLEDIDAAFAKREKTQEGFQSMVTFSGLLNALDGVASSEGRIIFMTTNHIEVLDQALIRPGRVDLREYVGDATPIQIRRMFKRFYEREDELAEKFVKSLEGHKVSTAALQGHFVHFKDRPEAACENVGYLTGKYHQTMPDS